MEGKKELNSQVNGKISETEEALTQLEGSISTICEALAAVQVEAVPPPPDNDKGAPSLGEELCPLAERINTLIGRIRSARSKIESEHERVRL